MNFNVFLAFSRQEINFLMTNALAENEFSDCLQKSRIINNFRRQAFSDDFIQIITQQ
jgi:hypothetical protein